MANKLSAVEKSGIDRQQRAHDGGHPVRASAPHIEHFRAQTAIHVNANITYLYTHTYASIHFPDPTTTTITTTSNNDTEADYDDGSDSDDRHSPALVHVSGTAGTRSCTRHQLSLQGGGGDGGDRGSGGSKLGNVAHTGLYRIYIQSIYAAPPTEPNDVHIQQTTVQKLNGVRRERQKR